MVKKIVVLSGLAEHCPISQEQICGRTKSKLSLCVGGKEQWCF